MISASLSYAVAATEVVSSQVKKGIEEIDSPGQIATDAIESVYDNGLNILLPTTGMKLLTTVGRSWCIHACKMFWCKPVPTKYARVATKPRKSSPASNLETRLLTFCGDINRFHRFPTHRLMPTMIRKGKQTCNVFLFRLRFHQGFRMLK